MAEKNDTDYDIKKLWPNIAELEYLFKMKTKFQSTDESFHRALVADEKNLC